MLAQITQTVRAGQVTGGLRNENLPAVTGRRDPGRAMNVDADIALVGDEGLSRVQSHAHLDRACLESFSPCQCSSHRIRRLRESDEKRVPLSIHLHATMPCERVS